MISVDHELTALRRFREGKMPKRHTDYRISPARMTFLVTFNGKLGRFRGAMTAFGRFLDYFGPLFDGRRPPFLDV